MNSKSEKVTVELEVDIRDIERAERFLAAHENGAPFFRVADRDTAFALLKHLVEQSKIEHP